MQNEDKSEIKLIYDINKKNKFLEGVGQNINIFGEEFVKKIIKINVK